MHARSGKVSRVCGRLYSGNTPVSLHISDGLIQETTPLKHALVESCTNIVAPGLIDIQVNGYQGVDFSAADLTVAGVCKVTQALRTEGVTTYLPTVITGPRERLLRNLSILAEAVTDPDIALSIPGFHLEGPYISGEDGSRGAHDRKWVRHPDWQEFMALQRAANEGIVQITVAPELDGAISFIKRCVEAEIVVALGHHNAPADIIKQAVDAGAVLATHLGNAYRNWIHRHDNALWPQLAEDRLSASIIVDGFHLNADEVKVFFRAKGVDKTILVSDVTMFAGMPAGEYTWNDNQLVLTPEGMIRYPAQKVLAGASLPLRAALTNAMKFTDCSLAEALQMVTANPARLFGLTDRGEIKPGMRADLIVFKYDDGEMIIQQTLIAGRIVHEIQI